MSALSVRPNRRTPPVSNTRGCELPSLTGLRWVAAFLVFGFHISVVDIYGGAAGDIADDIFRAGATGVSFFFILSGFILAWVSPGPSPGPGFLKRRFARVYPLHVATALLALASIATLGGMRFPELTTIGLNLTLTHAWSPDFEHYQSLNSVSWTLSCEAFFYLSFPLVNFFLEHSSVRLTAATAAISLGVATLGPALAAPMIGDGPSEWFFHWSPVGRLPEFILGVALCRLVILNAWPRWASGRSGIWLAVTVSVIGYLTAPSAPQAMRHAACTVLGFALLIAATATSDLQGRRRLFGRPSLVFLGKISFAFYLVHLMVIRVFEAHFGYHPKFDILPASVTVTAIFVLSLVTAWLLHSLVENPMRTLILTASLEGRRSPRDAGSPRQTAP